MYFLEKISFDLTPLVYRDNAPRVKKVLLPFARWLVLGKAGRVRSYLKSNVII